MSLKLPTHIGDGGQDVHRQLCLICELLGILQDLDYSPEVPLEEGVQRFCKWFYSYYALEEESAGSSPYALDWSYNPL